MIFIFTYPILLIGFFVFLIIYGAFPLLTQVLSIVEWIILIVAIIGAIIIPIMIFYSIRDKETSGSDKWSQVLFFLVGLAICVFVLLVDLGPVVDHMLKKQMEYYEVEDRLPNVDSISADGMPVVGKNDLVEHVLKSTYVNKDGRIIYYTGGEFNRIYLEIECDREYEGLFDKVNVPIEFYIHLYEGDYKDKDSRKTVKKTNDNGVKSGDLTWQFEQEIDNAQYVELEFEYDCRMDYLMFEK